MTELFDQEAAQHGTERTSKTARDLLRAGTDRVVHTSSPMEPASWESVDYKFGRPAEGKLPAPDPDPRDFPTAAAHSAAYVEQKNQEYRLEQVFRNVRGSIYLSECGVSQTGIDEYLAGNKPKDASPLRVSVWRFDAWTQRHFWDVILVIVALFTVVGFGVVAAHAEINEDSAYGFIAFLLGIGGMTAEVIRRGRE